MMTSAIALGQTLLLRRASIVCSDSAKCSLCDVSSSKFTPLPTSPLMDFRMADSLERVRAVLAHVPALVNHTCCFPNLRSFLLVKGPKQLLMRSPVHRCRWARCPGRIHFFFFWHFSFMSTDFFVCFDCSTNLYSCVWHRAKSVVVPNLSRVSFSGNRAKSKSSFVLKMSACVPCLLCFTALPIRACASTQF